jgi:hypothetical protein
MHCGREKGVKRREPTGGKGVRRMGSIVGEKQKRRKGMERNRGRQIDHN